MDILVGRLSCCSSNGTLLNIVLFHTDSDPLYKSLGHQYSLQYGTLTNNIYRNLYYESIFYNQSISISLMLYLYFFKKNLQTDGPS